MGIPLMNNTKDSYTTKDQKYSVYEDALDNTDPDAGKNQALDVKRWKHSGPSISGMREGDFNLYVTKAIRSRKAEFRKFMIDRLVDKRVRDEETKSRDRFARQISAHRIQRIRQDVAQNYDVEEKRLREEHARGHLGSELTAAICDFLDLPGVISRNGKDNTFTRAIAAELETEAGPPTTHPAAGLSHLRSNAVLEMHPLWGPQAERTPVLARVVRPRNTVGSQDTAAWIGVGGIVTRERAMHAGAAYRHDRAARNTEGLPLEDNWLDANRMTHELDPDLPNGNKIWVQPDTARIDEKGHIHLNTSRSSKEAIAVRTAKEEPILQATSTAIYTQPIVAAPGTRENANYGRALPDQRRLKSRSFKGFDDELKQMPASGQPVENSAIARIRGLMGQR
jgi:hypothetical protein